MISFLGDKNSEKKYVLKKLNKKIKHHLLTKKNTPTIIKTRYLDDYRKTKMLGVYELNDDLINDQEEKRLYKLIKSNLNKYDIIIVADFFASEILGGAELTTQALIDSVPEDLNIKSINSAASRRQNLVMIKSCRIRFCF